MASPASEVRGGQIRPRSKRFIVCALTALLGACKPEIRIQPVSLALPARVFWLAMEGLGQTRFPPTGYTEQ